MSEFFGWQRILLITGIGLFFYGIRPSSQLHRTPMNELKRKQKIICIATVAVICLTAFWAMTISDWWSDKGPDYHFQYEAMTDAVLDGHLYLDLPVSQELAAMENPYDSGRRAEDNVPFYWDHAFYKGHYYMYFGVVPVFLLFLPFRLIGIELYSYQATQIFVILIICGLFAVFYEISRRMCPKIPLGAFLFVSAACSWISVWYAVKYPALYCTANSSGVCMAVWGFYFCYRAFVVDEKQKEILPHADLGALFSALTFGCRPTVGLFCLSLLPLLFSYFKKCARLSDFGKVFGAFCIPFVVTAVLLMLYNYARFENPFEFGQSYQLTTVDQHAYRENKFKLNDCLNGLLFHFFGYETISGSFPFIHHDGCFIQFPILFIGLRSIGLRGHKEKGELMVKGLSGMIWLSVAVISFYHVMWAPIVYRRYALDFNFLLCFLVMFGVCGLYWQSGNDAKLSFWLVLLGTYTFVICFLLFFVDYDYSIATHQPEILEKIRSLFQFP